MNTTSLKRFAQAARRKLMDQVAAKMEFVLTTDSSELREKAKQINELRKELNRTSREQLTERVAYTWFNRLAALRFMDANDYQPTGIRVVSPAEGTILPQAHNEAKQGNLPGEWKVNQQKVYNLLDGRIPSSNPQNEAYRELLIAACNHLHNVFPFLFEAIDDYTELLLPDDLTSQFSIVSDVVEGMTTDDCQQVEVLGWLYQFYISEKKDEVFASKSKVKKEDIPAATQLFTPRWIVEYMVQNTVGKLWLKNRPNSKLRDHMPYYIESTEEISPLGGMSVENGQGGQREGDYLRINSPEEITLLDQACGSGHILVYAFELLYKIYEEEGYNPSEIPGLILEHNLYGFEIDERAAEIAGFALLMKAREYHRRIFSKGIEPHILNFTDLTLDKEERSRLLSVAGMEASDELLADLDTLQQATNFGSLIQPKTRPEEIEIALQKVNTALPVAGLYEREGLAQLQTALKQLQLLGKKFTCVVDNPPYMGSGSMNKELADFVKENYPDSKADLMACFMEKGLFSTSLFGFLSMVNMHSWMFLSSYESLRKNLIRNFQFESILHLGMEAFEGIIGKVVQTVSWVINKKLPSGKKLVGIRLVDYFDAKRWEKHLHFFDKKHRFESNQIDFMNIPGAPIGYWVSKSSIENFKNGIVEDIAYPRLGMATADNNRFLRFNWEVVKSKIKTDAKTRNEAKVSLKKWFPYAKGGDFRKWYGNNEYLVNWEYDGFEIKNFCDSKGKVRSHNYNLEYIFKKGISWSALSTNITSFRILEYSLFDNAGSSLFTSDNEKILLGVLNSCVMEYFLPLINPTLNYQPGTISKLPLPKNINIPNNQVDNMIKISQQDWDSKEISWDFKENELLKDGSRKTEDGRETMQEAFTEYKIHWTEQFFQLHQNEEELNRQFIEIYDLQEELTPDVPLEEITILQQELDRKALAKLNKRFRREPGTLKVLNYEEIKLPFDAQEVMAQFVSYAVGCMFGRYSLEKPGLILANQGETLDDYYKLVQGESPLEKGGFEPDDDNIIPALDDEWFEDDIVERFKAFLKASFGTENFERNLQFVEECLGKDIRRYLSRDFYTDHIRRYKKRPIYWMFSSPGGSFNALIYMHRYTPDTLSLMLNNYLRAYQEKLRARLQHLEQVQISGSATEKNQALKETERIDKVLLELQEYDRDILFPLATQRIAIDLDDGVLVNYNKFGKAIKPVAGLNDPKTKKKVRGFDWIDVSEIRD